MNYVNTNRINNMYSIKNIEKDLKKLEEMIEETKFIIYRKIL